MKTACFTGHRKIKEDTSLLSQRLYDTLEKHIAYGLTNFYIGGAIGFDMIAALTVLRLRKKYPLIKLHLVLPCPPEEQSKYWSDSDRRKLSDIISEADTTEIVCLHYTNDCMRIRNSRLVEYADVCFCYYDPNTARSGTGQTVRMARRKGVDVWNLHR